METNETEHYHNGKMKSSSSEKVVRFWNFAKSKNFHRADCSGLEWRHC